MLALQLFILILWRQILLYQCLHSLRWFTFLQKVTLEIDLILLAYYDIMDVPKQLQCLAERTSRYFGEYISPGKYQPREEFTCQWFIVHSFDLNMLGVQKQEMLLIWFSNGSNTCACKGCLCDVNISITFLFWT